MSQSWNYKIKFKKVLIPESPACSVLELHHAQSWNVVHCCRDSDEHWTLVLTDIRYNVFKMSETCFYTQHDVETLFG